MESRVALPETAEAVALKLLAYCRANDWAGDDPYDALNSRIFSDLPFLDRRLPRLIATQALKRAPVNIRRLMLIPKTQNPKAIALFLAASLRIPTLETSSREDIAELLTARLISLRSPQIPHWCWGYSFPWQTRTIRVPRGAPNLVCTSFVASALLDTFEHRQDQRCLSMAVSAAEYILNELYWTEGSAVAGFAYPLPSLRLQIYNANFLGAAVLCRVYAHTGDKQFLGPALRVARCSAAQQREDGSWPYGDAPTQQWIDNFHTGYNLCALKSIGAHADTTEFESCLRRGFEFYRAHFFREDGAPRYFHNHTYPIDAHCVAQSIITLLELKELDSDNVRLAQSVFRWAVTHMWDDRGFFYYRVLRLCTIRTSYMRWCQAWMLLALSMLAAESSSAEARHEAQRSAAVA